MQRATGLLATIKNDVAQTGACTLTDVLGN